jgi:hypothetical protein
MNPVRLVFLCALLSMLSCENHEEAHKVKEVLQQDTAVIAVNRTTLSEYFGTDEIAVDTLEHIVEVDIVNSKLLQGKKKKMGAKWDGPEAWASVAATYQSKLLGVGIDSLAYNVSMDGKKNRYVYSVKQLQKATSYIAVCEQFAVYLNSGDYSAIKQLLSAEILSKHSDAQIRSFLKSTFGGKRIDRTELIATKIVGNKYSFYINFWYAANQVQTYGFSFLEGNDKIGGIQVPK